MDGDQQFTWDLHNLDHVAQHSVRPEEVEQVLSGPILDLDHRVTEDGEHRWTAVGETAAGRLLVVVWTIIDDGSNWPITAYAASKRLESVYRRLTEGTDR